MKTDNTNSSSSNKKKNLMFPFHNGAVSQKMTID